MTKVWLFWNKISKFQRNRDTPTTHSWRLWVNCYIFSHCKSHPFSLASNRGEDTLPFVRTPLAFGIWWLDFHPRLYDVSTEVCFIKHSIIVTYLCYHTIVVPNGPNLTSTTGMFNLHYWKLFLAIVQFKQQSWNICKIKH